ncbi:hypothetical protein [Georgenia sp. SYP-B2076]|uniref:hypothetical protein n=1 Tax=Georgenia sp. SYP-B2076 TaxID=2495881 RepID=UPI000F8D0C5B|nr:hypothetical protein [Georgenia sp. SYP-B2076]
MLVVTVSALLAGCGQATSPAQVAPDEYVAPPVIAPEATKVFGADRVQQAYDELTAFALDRSYPAPFLDPQDKTYTYEELTSGVQDHLTPSAAEDFALQARAAAAGDADAQDAIRPLEMFHLDEPAWTMPSDGDPVQTQQITGLHIGLEEPSGFSPARLVVTYTDTAALEYLQDGATVDVDAKKTMTVWLLPSTAPTGPRWLIDQYDGDITIGPQAGA